MANRRTILSAEEQAHIDEVLREMRAQLDRLEQHRASPAMRKHGYVVLDMDEARACGLVPERKAMH